MENMMEDYENCLHDGRPQLAYLQRMHTIFEADFSVTSLDDGNQHKRQYILIDKDDVNCAAALDAIEKKSRIGLCLTGMPLGRNGRICWLQIAAGYVIMLFDVNSLGAELFRAGSKMKEILESSHYCKVMHRCDFAADALKHHFDVELENVLDTQMIEVELYQEENGLLPKNLQLLAPMCMKYLNIYCEHIDIVKKDWTHRPLREVDLEILCRKVMYLIPLYEELEGRWMERRKRLHDMRLNSIRTLETHDREFEHLNDVHSQNKLPLKFRKFTDLLLDRQFDVCRMHQLDENGFVINEILVAPKTNEYEAVNRCHKYPIGKFEEEALRKIAAGETEPHMSAATLYNTTAWLRDLREFPNDDEDDEKKNQIQDKDDEKKNQIEGKDPIERKNPIDWFIKREVQTTPKKCDEEADLKYAKSQSPKDQSGDGKKPEKKIR